MAWAFSADTLAGSFDFTRKRCRLVSSASSRAAATARSSSRSALPGRRCRGKPAWAASQPTKLGKEVTGAADTLAVCGRSPPRVNARPRPPDGSGVGPRIRANQPEFRKGTPNPRPRRPGGKRAAVRFAKSGLPGVEGGVLAPSARPCVGIADAERRISDFKFQISAQRWGSVPAGLSRGRGPRGPGVPHGGATSRREKSRAAATSQPNRRSPGFR
jgi:hypothetical protein